MGDFLPTTQQPADLAHHSRYVRVLPVREPAPTHGKPQIDAHTRQRLVRQGQSFQTGLAVPQIGFFQALANIPTAAEVAQAKGVYMRERVTRKLYQREHF
ncbi:MAG: hypothetical protein HC767_02325 [Akkermansiaceae bacterium]|nr:hypothetical protein [Akkermansiaceae bacterium]